MFLVILNHHLLLLQKPSPDDSSFADDKEKDLTQEAMQPVNSVTGGSFTGMNPMGGGGSSLDELKPSPDDEGWDPKKKEEKKAAFTGVHRKMNQHLVNKVRVHLIYQVLKLDLLHIVMDNLTINFI